MSEIPMIDVHSVCCRQTFTQEEFPVHLENVHGITFPTEVSWRVQRKTETQEVFEFTIGDLIYLTIYNLKSEEWRVTPEQIEREKREKIYREESEANLFALYLLIPEDFIRKDMGEFFPNGIDIVEDKDATFLAKRYGVSVSLMVFRLVELGLSFSLKGW